MSWGPRAEAETSNFLGLRRLDDRRDPLAATDAGGRQPSLQPATAQFEQERQQQARAGHPERVAKRNRAAVHVDLLAIQPQLFFNDGRVLRGERFVDLDEILTCADRRASGCMRGRTGRAVSVRTAGSDRQRPRNAVVLERWRPKTEMPELRGDRRDRPATAG